MRYFLIHRFGQADGLEYTNQPFSTENEAMVRACSLIGTGEPGDFLIRDDKNRVVADDRAIRKHCQTTSG